MTEQLDVIYIADDNVGDMEITLSNNDRSIIRNLILFLFEHADMDKEDAVELIEFSNRLSHAVIERMMK